MTFASDMLGRLVSVFFSHRGSKWQWQASGFVRAFEMSGADMGVVIEVVDQGSVMWGDEKRTHGDLLAFSTKGADGVYRFSLADHPADVVAKSGGMVKP